MSPLQNRDDLLELLRMLAERLERRGASAHVYVVGGAAIALVFDARRSTRDIDSVVLEGHGPLMDEVQAIGRDRGLPSTWLNEKAAMYVSREPDTAQSVVFDHPYLTVAAASAGHLLAMKLLAARGADVGDLRLLIQELGIASVEAAIDVFVLVFPGERLSDRARLLLEDLIAEQRG